MNESMAGVMIGGPLAGQVLPVFGSQQPVIDMENKKVLGKYLVAGLCLVEGHSRPVPMFKYFDRQELAQLEEAHGRKI